MELELDNFGRDHHEEHFCESTFNFGQCSGENTI